MALKAKADKANLVAETLKSKERDVGEFDLGKNVDVDVKRGRS